MTSLILFIPWYVCVCVCVLSFPLLSLCAGSGTLVWSARVSCCEVAAKFYWWLLFQKPDQIEVGKDGFKQWDGKTSLKTASDHCVLSSVGNIHLLTLHTFSHFNLARTSASLMISSISEWNIKHLFKYIFTFFQCVFSKRQRFCCFCVFAPQWSRLWTWRQWPTR